MPISGQHKLNVDLSDDNSEYKARFHWEALLLITEAYHVLTVAGGDKSNAEEPAITGELVRCACQYIEAHEWACRYAVHDDPPENDAVRMGKCRKKVDIIVERTQKGKHPRIRFEAKRLKRPSFPASAYVGEKGLGEFIAGNYATGDDAAGMLGYVQSDDCDYWAKTIAGALKDKKNKVGLIKGGQWERADLDNIDQCYTTRHNRPTVRRELLVYHLLLAFVGVGKGISD